MGTIASTMYRLLSFVDVSALLVRNGCANACENPHIRLCRKRMHLLEASTHTNDYTQELFCSKSYSATQNTTSTSQAQQKSNVASSSHQRRTDWWVFAVSHSRSHSIANVAPIYISPPCALHSQRIVRSPNTVVCDQ